MWVGGRDSFYLIQKINSYDNLIYNPSLSTCVSQLSSVDPSAQSFVYDHVMGHVYKNLFLALASICCCGRHSKLIVFVLLQTQRERVSVPILLDRW